MSSSRSLPSFCAALLCVGLFACGEKEPEGPPTYHSHIAPLIERRCVACHDTGRIGPFPLTSWEEVKPRVQLIAGAVAARRVSPEGPGEA